MDSRRVALFYTILIPLFTITVLTGIGTGSTPIGWPTILRVAAAKLLPAGWIATASVTRADTVIVWLIRVPRVIVAGFVGMGLAVAGAVMQALFRNPLAEPALVGAGSGAVLGAVMAFVTGWSVRSVVSVPLAAMAGAFLALLVVYSIATRGGVTPLGTLLLAGIAISSLLSAISGLLLSINIVNWQIAQEIVFWTMGGLDARSWTHVWLCVALCRIGNAGGHHTGARSRPASTRRRKRRSAWLGHRKLQARPRFDRRHADRRLRSGGGLDRLCRPGDSACGSAGNGSGKPATRCLRAD